MDNLKCHESSFAESCRVKREPAYFRGFDRGSRLSHHHREEVFMSVPQRSICELKLLNGLEVSCAWPVPQAVSPYPFISRSSSLCHLHLRSYNVFSLPDICCHHFLLPTRDPFSHSSGFQPPPPPFLESPSLWGIFSQQTPPPLPPPSRPTWGTSSS